MFISHEHWFFFFFFASKKKDQELEEKKRRKNGYKKGILVSKEQKEMEPGRKEGMVA